MPSSILTFCTNLRDYHVDTAARIYGMAPNNQNGQFIEIMSGKSSNLERLNQLNMVHSACLSSSARVSI